MLFAGHAAAQAASHLTIIYYWLEKSKLSSAGSTGAGKAGQFMDFSMYMPVEVISGQGCLLKNGEKLRRLGRRCLIVTGAHAAAACGALDDALQVLQ